MIRNNCKHIYLCRECKIRFSGVNNDRNITQDIFIAWSRWRAIVWTICTRTRITTEIARRAIFEVTTWIDQVQSFLWVTIFIYFWIMMCVWTSGYIYNVDWLITTPYCSEWRVSLCIHSLLPKNNKKGLWFWTYQLACPSDQAVQLLNLWSIELSG